MLCGWSQILERIIASLIVFDCFNLYQRKKENILRANSSRLPRNLEGHWCLALGQVCNAGKCLAFLLCSMDSQASS